LLLRRWGWRAAGAGLLLAAGRPVPPTTVTLQLKWVTQAQFAGYYVAKDKGFYEEAGLDVTIKPGGPDIAPPQVIAGGGADVIIDWMPSALASREKGVPLVNIAQPFKKSGMMLTCRKDTGITKPEDFRGQDARRLVLRQRVSLPVVDGQARHPDRGRQPTASRC
jgi:NitT/TauT family transport system substrate-binding protein